ncbi:hypothetical protein [Streptomyces shenzhenensis]|uniref:hypothetical protein n=1 Tax=Streptomyces shenzhenensis TaxID=943815 RepID=UPI0015F113DE|nr:hypothetical protein [Streptomyces shenzhenensis]
MAFAPWSMTCAATVPAFSTPAGLPDVTWPPKPEVTTVAAGQVPADAETVRLCDMIPHTAGW